MAVPCASPKPSGMRSGRFERSGIGVVRDQQFPVVNCDSPGLADDTSLTNPAEHVFGLHQMVKFCRSDQSGQ